MILAPISVGELIDKLTILDIKRTEYTDAAKLAHVNHEYELLHELMIKHCKDADIDNEISEIREVNKVIWDHEDAVRDPNNADRLAQLAKTIFTSNTRRAAIKKAINQKCNSDIFETKSYMSGD